MHPEDDESGLDEVEDETVGVFSDGADLNDDVAIQAMVDGGQALP